jgi:hypothetical protein
LKEPVKRYQGGGGMWCKATGLIVVVAGKVFGLTCKIQKEKVKFKK